MPLSTREITLTTKALRTGAGSRRLSATEFGFTNGGPLVLQKSMTAAIAPSTSLHTRAFGKCWDNAGDPASDRSMNGRGLTPKPFPATR